MFLSFDILVIGLNVDAPKIGGKSGKGKEKSLQVTFNKSVNH